MNTIEQFREYLLNSVKTSNITAKNYVSDVNKFVKWYESSFRQEFSPQALNASIVRDFINSKGGLITNQDTPNGLDNQDKIKSQPSARSFERYLSSLRRYCYFLTESKLITTNPFQNLESKNQNSNSDLWNLKQFKDYLYTSGVTSTTSKNYMVDINAFTSWLEYKGYHENDISKYIQVITPGLIKEYSDMLITELGLSESTLNRKMSSIRKYLAFGRDNGLISEDLAASPTEPEPSSSLAQIPSFLLPEEEMLGLDQLEDSLDTDQEELDPENQIPSPIYSPFPPLRLLQKLATPYFAFEELAALKLANLIKGKKLSLSKPNIKTPDWYKRYHNIAFVHYLHVAILIIYAGVIGGILYNTFFHLTNDQKALAAVAPPNVLSFQGRLTNNNGQPITNTTNVRFMVYSNSQATGSAYVLWQELDQVTPNSNGTFSVLLGNGSSCANFPNGVQTTPCAFPSNLFTNYQNLYIGITVENTPELTPRQQIANVPYAANSNSLQGMLPISATGATANVILNLDSSGDLTIGGGATPTFQATGGEFTLSGQTLLLTTNTGSATNVVIAPDTYGLIDLESPLVNNSNNGNITPGGVEVDDRFGVLATESAVAAFIVNNNTTGGDIFAASSSGSTQFRIQNNGDISLQNGASVDTLSNGTISIGNNYATTISLGRPGQNVLFPGYSGQNGVMYGEYGTGNLAQATTSSTGLCLISGAQNPAWGACNGSGSSVFQISSGAIVPNNSTADFFIGGQSTESAKFSVTNINNGTPQASISGNLIVMPQANNAAGGNVGIGVVNPTHTLQLWNDDAFKSGPSTAWTVPSDQRLKNNINTFTDGLNIINQINPVSFQYNGLGGTTAGTQGIGVIAQDVQKVAPYMIGKFDAKLNPNDTNTTTLLDFNPSALFFITINAIKELNSNVTAMGQNFSTKILNAGQITADSINVASDSISVAGQSLKDYITQIADSEIGKTQMISPLASIEELHTSFITPLGDSTPITLKGNVQITGAATVSGSLTADSASISGDLTASSASISGELTTNNLTTHDASVSGTLYANNIKADSIEGLDRRIIEAYHAQIASQSSSLIASVNSQQTVNNTQTMNIDSLGANFGKFYQGLMALGPSSFTQATFSDSITIGNTLSIGPNSINTVGTDLAIQPLKQGAVDFLAGAVRIETDGTLHVNNTAYFAKDVKVDGNLKVNNIQPDQNGLNIQGTASVSGGLTINKLNIFNAQPAYALSDTEAVATGSAGTDSIKPYKTELTIYNSNVTDNSLIYVSPIGNTNNNNPSLLRQDPGISFTVGIPVATPVETKFNWIIVN